MRCVSVSRDSREEPTLFNKGNLSSIEQELLCVIEDNSFIAKFLDYKQLTKLPDVSFEFIMHYKHLPWDWSYLSTCEGVPLEFIKNNKDIKWDYTVIAGNRKLNIEDQKWIMEMFKTHH